MITYKDISSVNACDNSIISTILQKNRKNSQMQFDANSLRYRGYCTLITRDNAEDGPAILARILAGYVTRRQRRDCRLRLCWPDNIDPLVTMSPHSDPWTRFSFKTKLRFVNSYCYSQILPYSPRLICDHSHNLSHNVDTKDKTASQIQSPFFLFPR